MSEIDNITVQELLEYIKSKNRNEKPNHIYHQIQWWYGEYVKEMILREHRV
jgi:hypothetical protein